ncbi:MAG: GNAT family N-acetyltransferase [Candidatus Dojkabacteria bacterium]|uniref:GNAT family N-acetyltransferase n=2 Tax=Candidatus Dojkabacteria TaxID=74243 RepID=A0A952AJB1_9BACT|nr:GNAT family N-acetyltransferase [Candidatus Dojkabacteria bacterium]WKZ27662.1 MAG: GNAT family N-acetyltransferase [Candidatus Dojkabacteria bacterium]
MVIEVLRPQDFEDFYQLFSKLMLEAFPTFSPRLKKHFLDKDYNPQVLRYWIDNNMRKVLIARDSGKSIGFIIGDNSYGGVSFISWLGVVEHYRGLGIGSKLLNTYEDFAISCGSHLLELFTFEKVKPFYQRHGFSEIGRREEGYYGQKNLIMNKTIGKWNENYLDRR